LRLKWRTVAIGSLLLNLAAVAVISAVAVVKHADALSTVALTLAIVAFICQLIVYAVQTSQASEQLRQAKDLNASTENLLAEARTRIEGTNQMMTSQYTEFMHLVTLKSKTESASTLPESEVVQRSAQVAETPATTLPVLVMPAPVPREPASSPLKTAMADHNVWTISAERARELCAELNKKGFPLNVFAMDVSSYFLGIKQGTDGSVKRLGSDELLTDLGLVTDGPMNQYYRTVVLTNKGVEAGQLLAGPWPPPKHLAEMASKIMSLRESLVDSVQESLRSTTT